MKKILILITAAIFVTVCTSVAFGQKPRPRPAAKSKPVIFAMLNDGKTIEPIGYVDGGKVTAAVDGGAEAAKLTAFHRSYYKPATTYRLIFGGSSAGTVTIKSSDPKAECSSNTAEVTYDSAKARLRGNVMALATNAPTPTKGSGVRRLPTPAERTEIEALVRSEMVKQKVSGGESKPLKYHNLTAVDVDGDGKAEMVGSFWVDASAASRALLYFIADKGIDDKYKFGFTDFRIIEQKDVMSGEISDLDSGVYHERLLDVFDLNGDGVAEVFTYIQSFEGAGFNVYRREGGRWVSMFEGSNYHCGY